MSCDSFYLWILQYMYTFDWRTLTRVDFLGVNYRGVPTPLSNHELSRKHLKERDVLAAEGMSMPPSKCWPEEGWVFQRIHTLRVFNTKCKIRYIEENNNNCD